MPNASPQPHFDLFIDILKTLEGIQAPYMIIGAFAATLYGISRNTHDIDIVVNLSEDHIEHLVMAYPLPRYYADPYHIRNAIRIHSMFNIIDTERGQKADLVPLSMDKRYEHAFQFRRRQMINIPGIEPFEIWCARPEDVIIGKLMAWAEGHSQRHPRDIYEMMVFHYLGLSQPQGQFFDEAYVNIQTETLGEEVIALWQLIKETAQEDARQHKQS